MTTAATSIEKNETRTPLFERDNELLHLRLSLTEFSGLVSIRYDDRWRRREWRVRGNEKLNHWIYDQMQNRDESMVSDAEVIEKAFNHFQALQARRGQLNFNSVYIKDYEKVIVVEEKNRDTAVVKVVKDCVDGKWRWATTYHVANGGSSSPLSFRFNIIESKDDAILAGANYIKTCISGGWEYKQGSDALRAFVNKIDSFINDFQIKLIQPTLF